MDITAFVMLSFMAGTIFGMAAMYGIVEYHFWKDNKDDDKSLYDFADYISKRRKK